jgi:hypothetical protein
LLWVQANKHMDVIGHAVNSEKFVALFLNDTSHVTVQVLFPLSPNQAMPVLDSEHSVNIKLRERIGHTT